jgi:hypothetical protein
MALTSGEASAERVGEMQQIQCGNLVYAGTRSSTCFADKFLSRVAAETTVPAARSFTDLRLGLPEFFNTPFCIVSGEGSFALSANEMTALKHHLNSGGFILASPSCSNREWDTAFRNIVNSLFPQGLTTIPMDHPIFSIVHKVDKITLKHGGKSTLEGLFINGRLAMAYSKDGLNDAHNAKGCCCCGGDMINESQQINVNIFTYSMAR